MQKRFYYFGKLTLKYCDLLIKISKIKFFHTHCGYVTFNYNLFYPLVFESDAIFLPFYHSRKKLRCCNAFQLNFLKLLLKRNATAQHQVIIKTESSSCSFTSRSADQGVFRENRCACILVATSDVGSLTVF